jgi:hypothetical protein|tara:strand:+ start:772 stop:1773 length:1002 start_codon:yes stop_codon:yes gene_type:complete
MIANPKTAKPLRAKPSRIHVDYERIIGEAIEAIPEPIKGDKGEQGDSIRGPQGIKGPKGDSIRGPEGIKGEKGDSIQGERGPRGKIGEKGGKGIQGLRGPRGKDGKSADVDYERIFGTLKRAISKERSLVDLSIKKKGSGTLVITKLYRDGSKKTESITIQSGGGGGGVGGVTQLTSTDASVTLSPIGGTGVVDLSVPATEGYPNYSIPAGTDITVPVNKQHFTSGSLTIDGCFQVDGQAVIASAHSTIPPKIKTVNFTVNSNILSYIANSSTAITAGLNSAPKDGELHYITNIGVGELTVSSVKTVAGLVPLKQYEGLTIEFSEDLDMWTIK